MDDRGFHPARIERAFDETPSLRILDVRLAPAVAASHRTPGQFVRVRVPGADEEAYFALASPPDGDRAQLLVKRGGALADRLAALDAGAALLTSPAQGPGFPVEASRGKDVLLFATGSGIAPIHAALQAIARERSRFGEVHLFFGARTRNDFAYGDELEALGGRAIRIHRVVSRPLDALDRYVGYVQHRFLEELPAVDDPVVFLAGRPEMVEAVTAMLVGAGIDRSRIHVNF